MSSKSYIQKLKMAHHRRGSTYKMSKWGPLFWLFVLPYCVFGQRGNVRFNHIGTAQGLSQNTVRCLYQDKKGFVWLGTKDGLNKYDGYKVVVYQKNSKNVNSPSSNDVKSIDEDSEGRLWIATWEGGVNLFDPRYERFTHYRKGDASGEQTLASDYVECVFVDSDDNVWIGTAADGLDFYDRKSDRFVHYSARRDDPSSLTGNSVSAIYEDRDHNIWVGTSRGLNVFDRATGFFSRVLEEPRVAGRPGELNVKFIFEDSRSQLWIGTYGGGLGLLDRKTGTLTSYRNAGNDVLLSVAEDNQGRLWIGTENGGLLIFDMEKESFVNYRQNDTDQTSLSSNTVNSVMRDLAGNMWLGTRNGGANVVNAEGRKFGHYRHLQGVNSLGNNIVNAIFEDSGGRLWVGTDGGGLDLLEREKEHFTHFRHVRNNPQTIAGDYVLTVAEDSKNDLWIGTWGEGITVFNPDRKQYRHYRHSPDKPGSLSNNYAFYIFRDSKDRMWVGTYGGGLDRYDPTTDSFVHYRHDPRNPNSLSSNYVLTIAEDSAGNLWIGTDGGGINRMDPGMGVFRVYKHAEPDTGLSNNSVSAIMEDSRGVLWIGTNYGLTKFDPKSGRFTSWFSQDGLPNDVVTGLLQDKEGNLWISTAKGISRFNPVSSAFENFSISDGLQGNEFKAARCVTRDGRMYFGGYNGFNDFSPADAEVAPLTPPVVFTGFQIFNEDVPVAQEGSPLSESINSIREIVLSHGQSVFTFEFAALNFVNSEKIQYAYMLEGFDKQWSRIGGKNNITYTNLDPGRYVLKVRTVASGEELAGPAAEITLVLTPPFWKTWWFRLLMLMLLVGLVVLIFHQRVAAVEQRNLQLERVVAARTRELQEANEDLEASSHTKDRFFSILAHDLKNPVSALAGISASLQAKFSKLNREEVYTYIGDISKSAASIQNLLLTLLDWARTQTRNIVYTPEDLSLLELLSNSQSLAESQIKSKHIRFSMTVDPGHAVFADRQMVDTIFRNLLSNSVKFTPTYGEIAVQTVEEAQYIRLSVRDSGVGMTPEQAANLYNIQRQNVSTGTQGETGTGLGLMVVKEFIEANKGAVSVDSRPGVGTTFTVWLPKSNRKPTIVSAGAQDTETETSASLSDEKLVLLKGKKILIVDDSKEIRTFLKLLLSDIFAVTEAEDGAKAIEMAAKLQPDVIISDMIMPVMNGLAFCQAIKADALTSHIPVILLTGQTNEESQLSGYEAGADSYLMKPVREPILMQVIYNFVRNREIIRDKFERSENIYPDDLEFNKADKEFLDQVVTFIEENLSDPELDHRRVSELTGLSRTVLYAKFKTLTGQGVHDFIKSVRLKKGLKLLQEGQLNVNQIAYEVGFNTPSYFSKSFAKVYGIAPSEYAARIKQQPGSHEAG